MARPYSVDLRERVLGVHEAGEGSQRVLRAAGQMNAGPGYRAHLPRTSPRIPMRSGAET